MSPLRMPSFSSPVGRNARPGSRSQAEELNPPALDLLREQRDAFGQRTIWPLLQDRRSLLLKGLTLGAGVFGVVLAITALVFLRLQLIRAEIGRYSQVEAQNAELTAQLGKLAQEKKLIKGINEDLKSKLTDVRPTSALLADLQLRVPTGIQLQTATTSGNALDLVGVAEEPSAFSRINALALELGRSPLFDPNQVSLKKIERLPETASTKPNQVITPAVKFTISSTFSDLKPDQKQQVLSRLGSDGMARRFDVMRQEGLIP